MRGVWRPTDNCYSAAGLAAERRRSLKDDAALRAGLALAAAATDCYDDCLLLLLFE